MAWRFKGPHRNTISRGSSSVSSTPLGRVRGSFSDPFAPFGSAATPTASLVARMQSSTSSNCDSPPLWRSPALRTRMAKNKRLASFRSSTGGASGFLAPLFLVPPPAPPAAPVLCPFTPDLILSLAATSVMEGALEVSLTRWVATSCASSELDDLYLSLGSLYRRSSDPLYFDSAYCSASCTKKSFSPPVSSSSASATTFGFTTQSYTTATPPFWSAHARGGPTLNGMFHPSTSFPLSSNFFFKWGTPKASWVQRFKNTFSSTLPPSGREASSFKRFVFTTNAGVGVMSTPATSSTTFPSSPTFFPPKLEGSCTPPCATAAAWAAACRCPIFSCC
mmetsp:Transcript_43914/g.86568  ORF Transcript_43914/g.86568 Transcript_43914/m.86568 type:complete len:335 (+) Transcript_43914:38-1042(+)